MKCNLALILLRECISRSEGQGEYVRLAWFKHLHSVPNDTFYRHINNLIDEGFLIRVRRDTYRLHPLFVRSVKGWDSDKIGSDKNWQYIPF